MTRGLFNRAVLSAVSIAGLFKKALKSFCIASFSRSLAMMIKRVCVIPFGHVGNLMGGWKNVCIPCKTMGRCGSSHNATIALMRSNFAP